MTKQHFKIVCEDCNETVASESSDRNHTCQPKDHKHHFKTFEGICKCGINRTGVEPTEIKHDAFIREQDKKEEEFGGGGGNGATEKFHAGGGVGGNVPIEWPIRKALFQKETLRVIGSDEDDNLKQEIGFGATLITINGKNPKALWRNELRREQRQRIKI